MSNLPPTMRAIAIEEYGGLDRLKLQTLPLPKLDAGEVLIRLAFADVAVWDPLEREGEFEPMNFRKTPWPLVLGSEGAGTVAAVGAGVTTPTVGDIVHAGTFLNAKGGFYAEYAVIAADLTSPIPKGLSLEQAAVLSGDGGTALRGLDDVLHVQAGESVMIFGAGGGLGHLAVQLAKHLGVRVFAVASGKDGVELSQRLGADLAIDGRKDDVAAAAKSFAPDGLDAALMAAGGDAANAALKSLKATGRCAYPHGVMPEPTPPAGITAEAYDGNLDADLIRRLHALVERGPFHVEVAKVFPLEQAADAHRFLESHYLGKVALKIA